MGDKKIFIAALIAAIILGSAMGYQLSISKSAAEISHLESVLRIKEMEFAKLSSQPDPTVSHTPSAKIDCLLCHDLTQTKSFHIPQIIMKIDERSGLRRRICIDCHGPSAYDEEGNYLGWSAEMQMTPIEMITYDESTGPNGVFNFPNIVPHTIHKRLLDRLKVIGCEDCHLLATEIQIPKADTNKGHVLVCQSCKYHPEEGNFIKIHVEDGGKGCQTCHLGDVLAVHKEKTLQLGKV
jgi:hypothetical protein